MNSFNQFLDNKILLEDAPPSIPPPTGSPGMSPGSPIGGGLGMPPPMGGMPPPPMGGGLGMPPPPMGGMPPSGGPTGPSTAPLKLKAYNVWDILEKILDQK